MQYKLGILSDVHATAKPLAHALKLLTQQGADQIVCLGDIAGYGVELEDTVSLLQQYQCLSILGNHDLWYLEKNGLAKNDPVTEYFSKLPRFRQLDILDSQVYCVHAQPPEEIMGGIRLYDEQGDLIPEQISQWSLQLQGFDGALLLVGHTHQYFDQMLGQTRVINPGSTKFNHSCAMLSLPQQQVEFFSLDDHGLVRSWNWSKVFTSGED